MTTTPGISVTTTRMSGLVVEQTQQILTVAARSHASRESWDVGVGDVAHAIGDLFEARHHQALSLLDRVDEVRRLHQRIVGAGIEPGDAAGELLDMQLPTLQIRPVDVGDLELAARRRPERGR